MTFRKLMLRLKVKAPAIYWRFLRDPFLGDDFETLSTGVLADQPHVLERARERGFLGGGLAERSGMHDCDFFREVPSGCRAYVMKNVLVDWNDEQACAILLNCRQAISSHAMHGDCLCQTKVRIFASAHAVMNRLAALMSWWIMPELCAASSASAIWLPALPLSSGGAGATQKLQQTSSIAGIDLLKSESQLGAGSFSRLGLDDVPDQTLRSFNEREFVRKAAFKQYTNAIMAGHVGCCD